MTFKEKTRMPRLLLLTAALFILPGCVIAIGNSPDDGIHWAGSKNEEGGVRHDGNRLSREVARAVAADGDLLAENVRISSKNRDVLLRGTVRSVEMLERALNTARSVEGVERVVSKITVDSD